MKIDEATFVEIKAAQEDGVSSSDCAEEMGVDIADINLAYSYTDYKDFRRMIVSEFSLEKTEEEKQRKIEIISPARAGYYKQIVAKKTEENSNLKIQRGWLLEQVYFLRKAVSFLEMRKRELEDGIKGLEKNINVGIEMMEQLEENQNFAKVSEKVEKKNK